MNRKRYNNANKSNKQNHSRNNAGGVNNQQNKPKKKPKATPEEQALFDREQQSIIVSASLDLFQKEGVLQNPEATFFDTHVHLEYILQNLRIQESENKKQKLEDEFFKERQAATASKTVTSKSNNSNAEEEAKQLQVLLSKFDGCIAIFCDPAAMSPSFGMWNDLLQYEHSTTTGTGEAEAAVTTTSSSSSASNEVNHARHWKIYCAFGIHPHSAKFYNESLEKRIAECHKLAGAKSVAYGEIGLDYHYDHSPPEVQQQVFIQQAVLGVQMKKPLIIHTREAEQDTLRILQEFVPKDHKIHVHCFTDSLEFAQKLLQSFTNLYFGFTGVATYESAEKIREVIKAVPLNRIVLETDGPYMPVNINDYLTKEQKERRDKKFFRSTAHCGHIPFIAKLVADLKGVSFAEALIQIRKNTRELYGV